MSTADTMGAIGTRNASELKIGRSAQESDIPVEYSLMAPESFVVPDRWRRASSRGVARVFCDSSSFEYSAFVPLWEGQAVVVLRP